jgi:hypothetical protein
VKAKGADVIVIADSPTEPTALVSFDLATQLVRVLRCSSTLTIDPGFLATP